jgi:hypothetical protein
LIPGGLEMAKRQRQYKRGTTYLITGPSEREGKFKLIARTKIERREVLMFQRLRKVKRRRTKKRAR